MKECSVESCGLPAKGRGYCSPHYQRWRRTGDVGAKVSLGRRQRGTCGVVDCARPHRAGGFCHAHYERIRLRGDAGGKLASGRDGRMCSIGDCPSSPIARGWCSAHYQRWKKYGDADAPLVRDGKGWIQEHGYRVVYRDGKDVLEHRYLMALALGRPLLDHEEVHHRNGIRTDNRLENFELWSTSQPAGQRVEDKVAWAVELLKLYAPERLADGYSG